MTLRNPYWFSAFGHMAALSALMLLSSLARPQLFVGGVSIVMPPPGSGPGEGNASPAPRPELEQEAAETEQPPQPRPEEQEQRRPQPELNVVKQPDPDGLLPLPEDDIPSERPDQRDPQPAPEPAPPPPAPGDAVPDGAADAQGVGERGTRGNGSAGTGSGIGVEGGVLGAHAPWYLVQLHDKIAANWRPPPVIGRSGEAQAKFQFVLEADGSVVQVETVETSGVRNYDMSGMRAIYNASPLPPIPEDLGLSEFGITLTFSKTY